MIKKTLIYTLKAIKFSTWISVIVALLAALLLAFFLFFPTLIKTPIETQLSQLSGTDIKLSKMSFGIKDNNIVLKIHNIQVISPKKQPIAQIEQLYWQVDFFNLFNENYRPSKIYADSLVLYFGDIGFNMSNITPDLLGNLTFLELLKVDKILLKSTADKTLMAFSALNLRWQNHKLILQVEAPDISKKTIKIDAQFSIEQFMRDGFLQLPILMSNEDFRLLSQARIYQQDTDSFFELNGDIDHINAANVGQYFLKEWVGELTSQWLNDAFISGSIEKIKIKLKQNLSQPAPLELNLSAHSDNMVLSFHPDWQNLMHLNADIVMDADNISIQVNNAELNELNLQDIQVNIADFTAAAVNIEVMGEIVDDSAAFIRFLSIAPLNTELDEVLAQFDISGTASAKVNVVIPLNKTEPTIDVAAKIINNHLRALDGVVEVENYNANAIYQQGRFSARGTGNIRNSIFEIGIDTKPDAIEDFVVEIGQQAYDFKTRITKVTEDKWLAEIDALNIKSKLSMDFSQEIAQFNIQNLSIDTQKPSIKALDFQPNDLPSMHLQAFDIQVDDYQFPNFRVDLHTQKNALNINNLEFEGVGVNQHNLRFNGHWLDGITTLVTSAKGEKLSDFLQQLKIKEAVKGGAFDFDLRLFCACNPWDMNLENISGYTAINVKGGEFSDQDPNIGRVLSLLNIESIAKRLKLEVDDLTHKGFVYDDIQARAYLQDSSLKLAHFEVNSSSSRIRLSGSSNVVDEQYDIVATVRPAISNSVPVATYLAGGGLAGLGVWLADKTLFDGRIINSVVDKVAVFKYKISGSWDNPIVK